ncbi:MAG: signal peptidase II [bacterium]|nr:signal peptidase II [bacterium]
MIILTILVILVDFFSKYMVSKLMTVNETINLINNFFRITYVKNTGAAFSIFSNNTILVIIISVVVIGFLLFYIYKNKGNNKLENVSYAFILGGAISNLIDRLVYGYVIDFLDFEILSYDAPIFNLADTFIVIGVILFLINTLRSRYDGNSSE